MGPMQGQAPSPLCHRTRVAPYSLLFPTFSFACFLTPGGRGLNPYKRTQKEAFLLRLYCPSQGLAAGVKKKSPGWGLPGSARGSLPVYTGVPTPSRGVCSQECLEVQERKARSKREFDLATTGSGQTSSEEAGDKEGVREGVVVG